MFVLIVYDPVLQNKLISSISKNFYQKMLLCGFLVFSIIPAITGGEMFFNNGYSLYGFIYLYLVGAYLRIYPLENSYFFKIFSKKLFRVIMICLFLGCALLNNILFSCEFHMLKIILIKKGYSFALTLVSGFESWGQKYSPS